MANYSNDEKINYRASQKSNRRANKMTNGIEKTKEKVTQVLHQAKETFKILETLEKETLAKARSFVKIPNSAERRRLTNDRILNSLKKLGVATLNDLHELEQKIQKLESTLASRKEPRTTPHTTEAH